MSLNKKDTPRQYLQLLLNSKYRFYRDADNGRTYFTDRGNTDPFKYQEYRRTDHWYNTWTMEMEELGFKTNPRYIEEVVNTRGTSAEFRMVTAQLDYLEKQYDGQDHLAKLIATVQTEDNALFAQLFPKWLVAVVAQCYGNVRNDNAFVFVGKQGNGKTGFFERLLWNRQYFANPATAFTFGNKEHMQLLANRALVLLDEMSSYSKKADIDQLKAAFSLDDVTLDPKYKDTMTFPRMGSFAGTTNRTDCLRDDTGDRRFIMFTLLSYDQQAYNAVDKKQLWAQLTAMYKQGFVYRFTQAEVDANIERNFSNYSMEKRDDQFIADILAVTGKPEHYIASRELQRLVDEYSKDIPRTAIPLSMTTIRAKLTRMGATLNQSKRVAGASVKVHLGVCLKSQLPAINYIEDSEPSFLDELDFLDAAKTPEQKEADAQRREANKAAYAQQFTLEVDTSDIYVESQLELLAPSTPLLGANGQEYMS